jgi:hypothetical protein
MRGRVYDWSDAEQSLREWTGAQRAAFALRQRIERQRWEREVLAPAQAQIVAEINEGQVPVLELPEGLV